MCISLRVRSFSFITVPSPALLLPLLETECELETATRRGRRGNVVCGARAWADPAEQLGGTSGGSGEKS